MNQEYDETDEPPSEILSYASNQHFHNIDKFQEAILDAAWSKATQSWNPSREWWNRLWQLQACDTTRHYHTMIHLWEMVGYYQAVRRTGNFNINGVEDRAILLAIFFHDAKYDGRRTDNEDASIELFQQFMSSIHHHHDDVNEIKKINNGSIGTQEMNEVSTLVVDLITATKHHNVSASHSTAVALFLDLDMAVLGKTSQAYLMYASLIRKEYNFVPREIYCAKRAEILDTFLNRSEPIYGTEFFRTLLENRAVENLRSEIHLLRNSIIPGE